MLGIPEVIVPPYPGITSAMGLLTTDLNTTPSAPGSLPITRNEISATAPTSTRYGNM